MARDFWSKRLVLQQLDAQIQFSSVLGELLESTVVLETFWRRRREIDNGSEVPYPIGPPDRLGQEFYELAVDLVGVGPEHPVRPPRQFDELRPFDHLRLPSGARIRWQDSIGVP